ncbi:MAG: glutamyl-tRNA reductase [Halieaceae bacterium]|nr:glutamyl-tRNA reductase [Halieaceae bacterium]
MKLTALGINHNSATLDLRERVAFSPEQLVEALQEGCDRLQTNELVILSTCNRTELFFTEEANAEVAVENALQWLADYHNLDPEVIRDSCYEFLGEHALEHMIQVASGLDSMVLGEPQIFGQLKSAYAVAEEAGTVGSELVRLFPRVFAIAKRVRTDTAIGENPVSVAYAAVDLAGHIFTDLANTRALLVGAGETIDLVARHLTEAGVSQVVVANRTLGRARELADRFGAEAVLLADIPEVLVNSDIVISSTGSQLPILGKGAVEHALKQRKHRPILMIDLAVPRDIEAQVGDLKDAYLYSVDDLREIVEENLKTRQDEARKADLIIADGVREYQQEQRSRDAVDTVKAFRNQAEQLRDAEVDKALRALERGEPAEQVLNALARSLTNKLIHSPTIELRRASAEGKPEVLELARGLLGIREVAQAGED